MRRRKMWRECVLPGMLVLELFSCFTAVDADACAGSLVCSSLDEDRLGILAGRKPTPLVCPKETNATCCSYEPASDCRSWRQCPQATLTSSIDFIHTVPDGYTIPEFLNMSFPCCEHCQTTCTPPTPSTSKLFLELSPTYSSTDNPNATDLGNIYSFELPDVYAGAYAQMAMDPPCTSDGNCCCCLRLDYYLTWSQLRVFGYNSRWNGNYIADWISNYFTDPKRICHGKWDDETCSYTKLSSSCTTASGHAKFDNANFDVRHALDRAANAGFDLISHNLVMEFSVTVVVALNQYCYKLKDAATNCHYTTPLKDCVYGTPQVVSTLGAGQVSYRQPFLVVHGSNPRPLPGQAIVCHREIDQGDDMRCLERLAENASGVCTIADFSLNDSLSCLRCTRAATMQYLDPNYFTSDRCKSGVMSCNCNH